MPMRCRQVATASLSLGLGHGERRRVLRLEYRVDGGLLGHGLQLLVGEVAAIHQPLVRRLSVPCCDVLHYWRQLGQVAPRVATGTPTMTWVSVSVAKWGL